MTQGRPSHVELARRIVAVHVHDGSGTRVTTETATQLFGTLFTELSKLIGDMGFKTLVERAEHLTRKHINASSPMVWSATDHAFYLPKARIPAGLANHVTEREYLTFILAYMIELLCDFIGNGLTWRILQRLWPEAFDD